MKKTDDITFTARFAEISLDFIRMLAIRRRKPIPWDLTWFPTYKCNLQCTYCNSNPGKFEKPNTARAIKKIIELKPSSISILGGEPYIVKGMVDYLRTIHKALSDCFIIVTTNGMVKQEHLIQSLPHLKTMCFSIDGMGEYNTRLRGGDTERILDNIKAVIKERNEKNHDMNIVVNTVACRHNARHLPDFFKFLAELDPTILCFSQALIPFDSPDSIFYEPGLVDELIDRVRELKEQGIRIQLVGRLATEDTRRLDNVTVERTHQSGPTSQLPEAHHDRCRSHSEMPSHRCYQERFNTIISAAGKVYTCRLYTATAQVKRYLHEALLARSPGQALRVYWDHFNEFVLQKPGFECSRFFGCPEWMNDIIEARNSNEFPPEIFRVAGRLPPAKVKNATEFIRANINPDFQAEFIAAPPVDRQLYDILIKKSS